MFKLGRRPALHTRETMRAALALAPHLNALGAPPDVSDDWTKAVKVPWGMYGNDQYGDCVMADTCHQIMVHSANAGNIVVPSRGDCVSAYFELTGGKDAGLDETAMCQWLMSTGFCGQKSAGTAMIDPTNLDHIRWCVQLFGACRLGITVTDRMQQQFGQEPWSDMDGDVEGGHDVPIVKYDARYAYVVTWGGIEPITWDLMADPQFCQESHAEVWPDFCRASGTAPNGFNLSQLLADLPQVELSQAA